MAKRKVATEVADGNTTEAIRFEVRLKGGSSYEDVLRLIESALDKILVTEPIKDVLVIGPMGQSSKWTLVNTLGAESTIKFGFSKEFKMNADAFIQAGLLSEKYGVNIVIVQTDNDFYSDALIKESVESKKYYISEESPKTTAQATDWLIRYQAEKDRYLAQQIQVRKLELLNIANEKRAEKSVQTAQDVAPRIAEISKQYADTNNGKEPSLHKLADLLNEANVPAPGGPQSKWYAQTVKRIITAEKSVYQK